MADCIERCLLGSLGNGPAKVGEEFLEINLANGMKCLCNGNFKILKNEIDEGSPF